MSSAPIVFAPSKTDARIAGSYDDLQITIDGVDFTKCVSELTISRPLPDIGTPQTWTGSMRLVEPLNAADKPESLNDLTNPGRWAKGSYPIVIRSGSNRIATVRILEYFYDDNPKKPYGEAQLGDVLTLFDFPTPPQAWQRLTAGISSFSFTGASPSKIIEKTLEALGLSVDLSMIPSSVALPTARDKGQGSLIKWAQQLLGERGWWLYVDEAEQIKAVKYPLNATSVLFSRALTQVETFNRRRSAERPVEHVVVSGACEYERPSSGGGGGGDQPFSLPRYEYDPDNGALARITTTSIVSDSKGNYSCQTTVEEALAVLNESLFRNEYVENWAMVTSTITTETKTADSKGRVIQEQRTVQKPLGAALSDLLTDLVAKNAAKAPNGDPAPDQTNAQNQAQAALPYYSDAWTVTADDETKTYTYENGVMVKNERTLIRLFRFDALSYAARVAEYELDLYGSSKITAALGNVQTPPKQYFRHYELWRRKESRAVKIARKDVTPREVVKWYFPRPLLLAESQDFRNAQPPRSDETRPDFETGTAPIYGEAKFKVPGTTQFCVQREDYGCETLSSADECRSLAQLLGSLKYQSYYGRQYVLPPPIEWVQSPRPFSVQAVHNGMFVGCGDVISINNQRLQIAFDGYYLGAISPVPDPGVGSYSFSPPAPAYNVELTAGYAATLTYALSGTISNTPTAITGPASSGYTVTYTKSDEIAAPTLFERLVIAEQWTSGGYGGGTYYTSQTIAYRTSGPPSGWNTGTLTFTAVDGSTTTLTQSNGGTWRQKDGSGNPTTPTAISLRSWLIAEQATTGGGYGGGTTYYPQTIIYDSTSTPSGWNTGALFYTAPNGSGPILWTSYGGTWQQKDGSGNPTTSSLYTY